MNILLATWNSHKKKEFQMLLKKHQILIPNDLGLYFNIEETGNTFIENALLKAEFLYNETSKPVIADDSGLCVEALGGAPGIYSARYGNDVLPENATFQDRYTLLLKSIADAKDRSASFVCALVYYFAKDKFIALQETVEGKISHTPAGSHGFGYDPVFFVPEYEKTMAELNEDVKNSISHRGKAVNKLVKILDFL